MRQFVEPLLPEGLALSWFNDPNEAIAMVRDAEVGWLDQFSWNDSADAIFAGEQLKWVNTILAGLDMVPIDYVRQKGIIITNGDRKRTRLNSSHSCAYRQPSSACKKKPK